MRASNHWVIFSDLDGTLLDHETYSFEGAAEGLRRLKEAGIPLVLCTSKTRAEIEEIRRDLGNRDPFITENGGAVFIPEGYFPFVPPGAEKFGPYQVIPLGTPYADLRRGLLTIRTRLRIPLPGFGDMTPGEIGARTQLPRPDLAKLREYDEPFLVNDPSWEKAVHREARDLGLQVMKGGRFHHLTGESDKGKAIEILIQCYRRSLGQLRTVGLGDSANDRPLLKAVDIPILVRRSSGDYAEGIDLPELIRTSGQGPAGWNEAILSLLARPGNPE